MSDVAIKSEGIGKCYRIGSQPKKYTGVIDRVTDYALKPIKNFINLKKLSQFNSNEAENVSLFWALRNIDFSINHGEAVGIIGKNGAGKSTLLKILAQITVPTEGQLTLRGKVASLLEVGTGFHPDLSGRDNVFINGAILGMSRAEIKRKFDEIVEFSGIEKFIYTPVKRYSSGMKVRLAFAVAAHLEPEILLIDEVLAVGDAAFQKKCLGKMQDLIGHKRTVLFVSHNSSAVTRTCSRVIYLEDGKMKMDGSAEEVMGNYLSGDRKKPHEMHWEENEAPSSDKVRLNSVSLGKLDNSEFKMASVEDKLVLKMNYDVLQPKVELRCGATFFTQGVCAFSTIEPLEIVKDKMGNYTTLLYIPDNLLAEGNYSIHVSIVSHHGVKIRHVVELDVISFDVYDPQSGNSAKGDYATKMAGIVMPKLDWETSSSS